MHTALKKKKVWKVYNGKAAWLSLPAVLLPRSTHFTYLFVIFNIYLYNFR